MKFIEIINLNYGSLQKIRFDIFELTKNTLNNYIKLPENKIIKKIIIFIYFKFLRKVLFLFYIIINSKISFKNPLKKKNIVLDQSLSYLSNYFLSKPNFFILQTRIKNFKKIYLTKKIIFYLIKNFFKNSLKINYFIILIKIINPKNIITFIDNSNDFFILSKKLKNEKINFFAIQNASRTLNDPQIKKNLYIDNYLVFGEYEKKLFKGTDINNFYQAGSIKAEIAKKIFLNQNIKKNIYDICFISEPDLFYSIDNTSSNIKENLLLAMKHTITFAKKYKKKIIIMGKSNINNINDQLFENKFYYDVIKNSDLKIHFNDKEKFENYQTIIKSKVIIGCMSSLLREAFAFKKKVFCCKYIPGTVFPSNGICTLKNKSYLKYEKQLKTIFKISYKNYLEQIDSKENLYNKKIDTINYLRNQFK